MIDIDGYHCSQPCQRKFWNLAWLGQAAFSISKSEPVDEPDNRHVEQKRRQWARLMIHWCMYKRIISQWGCRDAINIHLLRTRHYFENHRIPTFRSRFTVHVAYRWYMHVYMGSLVIGNFFVCLDISWYICYKVFNVQFENVASCGIRHWMI